MITKVYGNNHPDTSIQHGLHWCYAHGAAQDLLSHDILGVRKPIYFAEGVWPIILVDDDNKEHQAVLFRWDDKYGLKHGLCCLSSDLKGIAEAMEKYSSKSIRT